MTIVDIAKESGYSVTTVSRVLNNRQDVSPAAKETIMKIVEAHNFVPNTNAKRLKQIMEISLIENIQREDLNPIEEALAYKRLLEEFKLKQDDVAERVSKSRTAVTNSMRLLKLNEKVQQMVIDEMLTTGHARALLGIEDQNQQYVVAQQIFDQKLSVRDTEKLVKSLQKNKKKTKSEKTVNPQMEAIYKDLEEKLKKNMGTKVLINRKNENSGKIEIEYYSHDELDRIVNMLNSVQNQ